MYRKNVFYLQTNKNFQHNKCKTCQKDVNLLNN